MQSYDIILIDNLKNEKIAPKIAAKIAHIKGFSEGSMGLVVAGSDIHT